MTNTITKTQRAAIKTILTNSAKYDASTMRITRDGIVTAKQDADKTFCGNDQNRYHIGYYGDMVTQDGTIREGW